MEAFQCRDRHSLVRTSGEDTNDIGQFVFQCRDRHSPGSNFDLVVNSAKQFFRFNAVTGIPLVRTLQPLADFMAWLQAFQCRDRHSPGSNDKRSTCHRSFSAQPFQCRDRHSPGSNRNDKKAYKAYKEFQCRDRHSPGSNPS